MITARKYGLQPPNDWGDDCADQLLRGKYQRISQTLPFAGTP